MIEPGKEGVFVLKLTKLPAAPFVDIRAPDAEASPHNSGNKLSNLKPSHQLRSRAMSSTALLIIASRLGSVQGNHSGSRLPARALTVP